MKRISLITWSSALVAIVAMAPEVAAQSTSTTSPNPADPPRPTVKTGEAKPAVPEAKPAVPAAKPDATPVAKPAAKAAAKPAAKKPAKPAAKVKTPAPVLLNVDANNKPQSADTTRLPQFEQAVEYEPRSPSYKVSFSLEDADLNELVRVIGQLTGKRFIFGGRVRNIKASVYSPQKVTVEEAYEAFLSILDSNGLTVVPHGKFLKIVETGGISSQTTPMSQGTDRIPTEDRFITRLQRIGHVSADEVAGILGHFKSKDADITVYSPGNMLIITDTGANIRRMMDIVNEIDTVGVGDQIWIEPIHYGSASDMASRVNDIFDLKSSGSSKGGGGGGASVTAGSDLHVSKVISDDRSNSLIIVSTERAYLRILEFLKRIDTPSAGEGEIHVLALQHADATELYKTLNEIVTNAGSAGSSTTGQYGAKASTNAPNQNIFEGGVKVSADKATNSIVITSSNRDYAAMRAVLDKLDQPRRQVFIEAVIMDLSIGHTLSLGVSFHGGAQEDLMGPGKSTIIGGLNVLKSLGPPTANTDLIQGMALGIRGPDIPGSQNFSSTGLSIPAFGAVINAMAMNNDKDVLSTPHILATDNIKAEINVGENTPLQTSSGGIGGGLGALAGAAGGGAGGLGALGALGGLGGGFSPQRQDVGTKIIITPHLNESNEVRLELQEEISEVGHILVGNLGAIPITKRTANTTLIVRDQQTVVIGGLMKNSVLHTQEKVPLLGDIPVLGVLFRSSKDSTTKSNLILILTPYIIREQSDLRAIFERKMQERQQFLDRYFVFSDDQDYQAPKDYSRTNGLVEHIRQSFIANAERARLDDLSRPKDVKSHTPGQPLEIVNGRSQAPSNLNVAPPPRSVPVRGGNFDHDD